MLDVNHPQPHANPMPPKMELAKFPPDDFDAGPPGGFPPGGGVPAGFDPSGGDFKKGRFNPWVIIVGLLAAGGLIAFLILGATQEAERLTIEQAQEEKKAIYVLPEAEQQARWLKWAAVEGSDDSGIGELRQEAFKQLAWHKDPAAIPHLVKALSSPSDKVAGMAATALAYYGQPDGEPAKDGLLQALAKAGPGTKPQIGWALVELGDSRAFDEVLKLYRSGHLSKVERLGGGIAFDPEKLVKLITLDKLATYAGDESAAVRQMVATVLSRNAEPKYTATLIKLLEDQDAEVARQAAPGLGKIGDASARDPLLAKLRDADKDSREKYLDAIKDGVGAVGLVLALGSVPTDDEKASWYGKKQIFDLLEKLADPRGGTALFEYIQTKPHIHYQTRAAFLMAEIGDVRAVPTLAKRLRMDPLKIYSDQYDWEMALKRDDNERVIAARMIADLAVLHPDKAESIREQAEDAVIFWIHELPSPHANGLRALAAMGSTKDIEALRKWANPDAPLPKEGQQPPMPEEWVIAQSALRYAGWMKDEKTWPVFEKMLRRRPEELNVTMDGLMAGGLAILGMSLRAIGVGAAHGMSEWGDPKAFKPLLEYVEDEKENEQSRMAACAAMAWVAEKDDILTVAKKIQEYSGNEKSDQFRRECLLETLIQRPMPGTAPALMQLMTADSAIETRHQVARAIAKSGIDKDTEAKLFEMLKDEVLMNDAALALILGGTPDVAARAVASYSDESKKAALEDLQHLWFNSFGYWSTEDLAKGLLFKYVDNAVAISRIEVMQTRQEWARAMLERQFDNLVFDNGPHSFTRVVLRKRLYDMAKGDDKEKREGAIRTLHFMKEQGVLLALRDESGETGRLAREAYHELMNPKIITGVKMPQLETAKSDE